MRFRWFGCDDDGSEGDLPAGGASAESIDAVGDDHDQSGGRTFDGKRATRKRPAQKTADDSGDHAHDGREARGRGNAEAERKGEKEDDKSRT